MEDQEYLNLFNIQPQQENINETKQVWNNLSRENTQQWENINETPNMQQYNINENINDGWNNADFVVETRINGQKQNNYQEINQYNPNSKRRQMGENLNGLDQYSDDDNINEVYRQPVIQQPSNIETPPVQSLENADYVSIEMFENMNNNAMMTFIHKKFDNLNVSRVTNTVEDRQVRFLNS